jgi:hypothetical protein
MEVGSSGIESETKNHENWHHYDFLDLFPHGTIWFLLPQASCSRQEDMINWGTPVTTVCFVRARYSQHGSQDNLFDSFLSHNKTIILTMSSKTHDVLVNQLSRKKSKPQFVMLVDFHDVNSSIVAVLMGSH